MRNQIADLLFQRIFKPKVVSYSSRNMSNIEDLHRDIDITRREIKNIRQELMKQKAHFNLEVSKIEGYFSKQDTKTAHSKSCNVKEEKKAMFPMVAIGFIRSCFHNKNGIPRQPQLCPDAKATLTIEKSCFPNPEQSLIGLNEFSHIWVLFVFHKNSELSSRKAKVHPPRMNGASTGVFSTRSPHRPSPLGLSLIKLDKVEGNTLFLSGIDLLDGTPVLDIKPYIPLYDIPQTGKFPLESHNNEKIVTFDSCERKDEMDAKIQPNCSVPPHLRERSGNLDVIFTNRARDDLRNFYADVNHDGQCDDCSVGTQLEAERAITSVLQNDPRSVYRRQKCSDRLYYFSMGNLHVTCWYDGNIVEVLKIKSISS